MTNPFQGRAPSEGAPYDNALTVTSADGDHLPVIPSAFYLPGISGDGFHTGPTGQDPFAVHHVSVEMQNGAEITFYTAGVSKDGSTIFVPMRICKILWDKCSVKAVTLLW